MKRKAKAGNPSDTTVALQFSRNPKVAEHGSNGRPYLANWSCFNSAATQKLRNTIEFRGLGTHRRVFRVHSALQFSRNPKVAEHLIEALIALGRDENASIQPQPKSCGTQGNPPRTSRRGHCFNSAATQKLRNTAMSSMTPRPRYSALQFSRNPKVAEHARKARQTLGAIRGASIQPQPKSCGTRESRWHALRHGPRTGLQFSRNPKVAEHGLALALRLSRRPGFNSAATQKLRNTAVALQYDTYVHAASIQPQPKSCGTRKPTVEEVEATFDASIQPQPKSCGTPSPSRSPSGKPATLQFSRNPKVAEHDAAVGSRPATRTAASIQPQPKSCGTHLAAVGIRGGTVPASIQPQPKSCGTHRARLLQIAVGASEASIQPQPKSCGTRCDRGMRVTRPSRGFNSAATQKLRNTIDLQHDTEPRAERLQFSRNPKVAEHNVWHSGCGGDRRASIQPQPKSCGTP